MPDLLRRLLFLKHQIAKNVQNETMQRENTAMINIPSDKMFEKDRGSVAGFLDAFAVVFFAEFEDAPIDWSCSKRSCLENQSPSPCRLWRSCWNQVSLVMVAVSDDDAKSVFFP